MADVGLTSVMKGQTELEVVKLKSLPQLSAKGLSTLYSPVLDTLNFKSSGVTSDGIKFCLKYFLQKNAEKILMFAGKCRLT